MADVGDDNGECLCTVKNEDGYGEAMTAADLAEVLIPEAESGDWETAKHLYGGTLVVKSEDEGRPKQKNYHKGPSVLSVGRGLVRRWGQGR